jgi:hypothetical protein
MNASQLSQEEERRLAGIRAELDALEPHIDTDEPPEWPYDWRVEADRHRGDVYARYRR